MDGVQKFGHPPYFGSVRKVPPMVPSGNGFACGDPSLMDGRAKPGIFSRFGSPHGWTEKIPLQGRRWEFLHDAAPP